MAEAGQSASHLLVTSTTNSPNAVLGRVLSEVALYGTQFPHPMPKKSPDRLPPVRAL